MKKYCYCMTGNKVWLDSAIDLYERGVAKPVLWLGDDCHYNKATKVFGGGVVVRMLDFVHYQQNIKNINYNGENIEFFSSKHYLRAKDRCLKMMDRLDLYGTFGRIDREAIFNKLAIWTLKRVEESQPDALVVVENPHSHAQYLLYEICIFLDIEIVKFNTWMPVPLLFLQYIKSGVRQKNKIKIDKSLSKRIEGDVLNYIDSIVNIKSRDNYELSYMKSQRLQSKWVNSVITFIKSGCMALIKESWFQIRMSYKKDYYHINPFRIGFFGRSKIKRLRKKNLLNEFKRKQESVDLAKKYVYYALHFEPERTTNPDGGDFHDQVIAITRLRKLLPDDIDIFVKEHPSQFYMADKGSRGRSPLFYDLIKSVNGVKLVSENINSLELVKHSIFVATISGSVAFEAAVMNKKALIFGDSWFNGCPNITSWSDNFSFESITKEGISETREIINFLLSEKELYAVPGCQNHSAQNRFSHYLDKTFVKSEFEGVTHLLEQFFTK
jgi:hypothetical protein